MFCIECWKGAGMPDSFCVILDKNKCFICWRADCSRWHCDNQWFNPPYPYDGDVMSMAKRFLSATKMSQDILLEFCSCKLLTGWSFNSETISNLTIPACTVTWCPKHFLSFYPPQWCHRMSCSNSDCSCMRWESDVSEKWSFLIDLACPWHSFQEELPHSANSLVGKRFMHC